MPGAAGLRVAFCAFFLVSLAAAGTLDRVTAEVVALAPVPSSSRYVPLNAVAVEFNGTVVFDEATGVFTLQAGDRRVAVTAGVSAALVGSSLVVLREEVVERYGRAYVPRSALSLIQDYLRVKVTARRPEEGPRSKPGLEQRPRSIGRVCIDAGHGGSDPGAVSPWGLPEEDVTLSTALALASELRAAGLEVVMTRESDTAVELPSRPAIAARCRADLLISIHANSIKDSSFRGIEIFYCDSPGASGSAAVRRQSAALADALRDAFRRAGLTVRKIQNRDLRVCRLAEMPAALVEIGYLTNRSEERELRTRAYRERVAKAIADGIVAFRNGR